MMKHASRAGKMSVWVATGVLGLLSAWQVPAVPAEPDDVQLQLKVTRREELFHTVASFHLPLSTCEAYRFITDFQSTRRMSGVVDVKVQRLSPHKVRVERWVEERVMLFPVKMHSVIEYTEQPYKGTDFVQTEGDSPRYEGFWRIEPDADGSIMRFQSVLEPDASLPMFVIQYFIQNKVRDRFNEMARSGASRKGMAVPACD